MYACPIATLHVCTTKHMLSQRMLDVCCTANDRQAALSTALGSVILNAAIGRLDYDANDEQYEEAELTDEQERRAYELACPSFVPGCINNCPGINECSSKYDA